MKKVEFLLIVFLIFFISGCSKTKFEVELDTELDKYNLEEIILDNISLSDEESLYAIAINKDLKEVFLKYEEVDSDSIRIIEIMNYDLNFSFQDLLKKLEKIEDKDFKNAMIAITNNAKKIEIIDNAEIKEVLQIKSKFNALAFYYDIDGTTNKIVITYDLGDYYIANETTREIYYPIYINYSDFS